MSFLSGFSWKASIGVGEKFRRTLSHFSTLMVQMQFEIIITALTDSMISRMKWFFTISVLCGRRMFRIQSLPYYRISCRLPWFWINGRHFAKYCQYEGIHIRYEVTPILWKLRKKCFRWYGLTCRYQLSILVWTSRSTRNKKNLPKQRSLDSQDDNLRASRLHPD